ncbi:hypothetical protein [Hymenobacter lucidus]|nr:hypothetical protein [Hymenobacter lucidus]
MEAVANNGHYFSVHKARTELSLTQTELEKAIAEAFQWFKVYRYV